MPNSPKGSLHFSPASRALLEPHLPPEKGKPDGSLSGPQLKAMTHYLRSRHNAILIGVGTAIADDPGLNCQLEGAGSYGGKGLEGQPRPIIIDPTARWDFSEKSRVFQLASEGRGRALYVITGLRDSPAPKKRLLNKCGGKLITLEVINTDVGKHMLEWKDILEALRAEGLSSVMIEGGGGVINSLLLPDYSSPISFIIVTIALTWLGKGGVIVSPQRRPDNNGRLVTAARLESVKWHQLGEDVCSLREVNARINLRSNLKVMPRTDV